LAAKRLKQLDIPYQSSHTHSGSHAGYYPGSTQLSIKLTFDPETGKLYGAQCVGYDGVDKRIDLIATFIKSGGSVFDLAKLEHCYAPPFSSAKDPVAIAGYVAGNIVTGRMPVVSWREMQAVNPDEITLLDVRTQAETAGGRFIPGSLNIPLDELRERLSELPENKPIWVYCGVGLRGYLALRILMQRGFTNVKNLSGGYKTYSTAITGTSGLIVSENEFAPTGRNISNRRCKPVDTNTHTNNSPEGALQCQSGAKKTIKIDACGLQCPGPILKLKKAMDEIADGETIEVIATDAGFPRDAESWCQSTGNRFVSGTSDKGQFTVVVEKQTQSCNAISQRTGDAKTFIMFSDDLDKALATFVLANGAAATGKKVTIFFTFWGLNVIKKVQKPNVSKDFVGKMFGMMLPSSSLRLKLSKMNMFGLGAKMMRSIMKAKGIESLESLRAQALEQGVEFIACQMSMDVMGVKREELLDECTLGGVATYMERAENANINLFI
jgi:peroxiredoxin family protein/rhodanese-related sulfurtransferase/TusA-related sulfurtransferase